MAVPKQRTSRARRDKRRAHDSLSNPSRSLCPQCSAPKHPHRICAQCGTYKGRQIVQVDEQE